MFEFNQIWSNIEIFEQSCIRVVNQVIRLVGAKTMFTLVISGFWLSRELYALAIT